MCLGFCNWKTVGIFYYFCVCCTNKPHIFSTWSSNNVIGREATCLFLILYLTCRSTKPVHASSQWLALLAVSCVLCTQLSWVFFVLKSTRRPPFLFSWDNVHLRQRRRPHYIQVAGQWETEHQDRQADCRIQQLPERRHPGSDWQRSWSGGLSHAAHSKFSHNLLVSFVSGTVSPFLWFILQCLSSLVHLLCVLGVSGDSMPCKAFAVLNWEDGVSAILNSSREKWWRNKKHFVQQWLKHLKYSSGLKGGEVHTASPVRSQGGWNKSQLILG